MRILVVEDSEKMAALLKRGLEEEGVALDVTADWDGVTWFAREGTGTTRNCSRTSSSVP